MVFVHATRLKISESHLYKNERNKLVKEKNQLALFKVHEIIQKKEALQSHAGVKLELAFVRVHVKGTRFSFYAIPAFTENCLKLSICIKKERHY